MAGPWSGANWVDAQSYLGADKYQKLLDAGFISSDFLGKGNQYLDFQLNNMWDIYQKAIGGGSSVGQLNRFHTQKVHHPMQIWNWQPTQSNTSSNGYTAAPQSPLVGSGNAVAGSRQTLGNPLMPVLPPQTQSQPMSMGQPSYGLLKSPGFSQFFGYQPFRGYQPSYTGGQLNQQQADLMGYMRALNGQGGGAGTAGYPNLSRR